MLIGWDRSCVQRSTAVRGGSRYLEQCAILAWYSGARARPVSRVTVSTLVELAVFYYVT
jgi:hypothetical protein